MKYFLLQLIVGIVLVSPATGLSVFAQSKKQAPTPKGDLVKKYGVTQEQENKIKKFSKQRSVSIDSLAALNLPVNVYRQQRDSVTDIYYERVQSILTPAQREKFSSAAFKAARSREIKILNLSVDKEIAMGALKSKYEKSMKSLDGLPKKEIKAQRIAIEVDYKKELRSLLGDEKYGEWLSYKEGATERKFKNRFGFTDRQYEQYKAIEKWQAVQVMIIKSTANSPEERLGNIEKAKCAKVDSLRAVLPQEQFDKWYEYYQYKEVKRAKMIQ